MNRHFLKNSQCSSIVSQKQTAIRINHSYKNHSYNHIRISEQKLNGQLKRKMV